MRSPLVMPRAGQKSLRRLVSFTRRSPSATSTSSWSRGIIPPVGQRARVGGGRRGPRRVAGWWSVVARGIALGGTQSTPTPALASAALLVVAQAVHAEPRGGDPALRAAPRRVAARRPGRLPRALGRGHDFPIAGARRTAPWPRRLRRPGAPGLRLRAPALLRLHAHRGRGRCGARRVAHRGRAARRRAAYRVVGDERRGGAGRPHPALARVLEPGRRGVSFAALFGRSPSVTADAPGRVNLIGEHTDYNQGFVLPTPIPQRTVAEVAPRADEQVRAASASLAGAVAEYALGAETPGRGWLDYVQGLTWALRADGALILGFDLRVVSSVPIGAGLASSAALEVAVLRALRAAFRLPLDDVELALLGQRAENEFVGARVGVMDQMAASLGVEGRALLIDTRSLEHRCVPLPAAAE